MRTKAQKGFNDHLFDKRGMVNAARFASRVAGCCVCGSTALIRVGAKGYCKIHRSEALKHAEKVNYNKDYNAAEQAARRDFEDPE